MATAERTPAPSAPEAIRSLPVLRAAHEELLRQVPPAGLDEAHEALVAAFLPRAAAAGAFLDLLEEREAAQGLLDYWKATLYTHHRRQAAHESARLPSFVLADFDPALVRQIAAAADARLQTLAATDQGAEESARTLLLKLVQLPAARGVPEPVELERSRLLQGEPRQAERVLDALLAAGVLELVGPTGVRLRSAALLRGWPKLVNWLEKRLLFREAALFWDRHGRDRGALFTRELLLESHSYRDLNTLEKEFVAAVNAEADRQEAAQQWETRYWRGAALVIGVLALAVATGLGWLLYTENQRRQFAAERATFAIKQVELATDRGNLATKRAELAADREKLATQERKLATDRETVATDRARLAESRLRQAQIRTLVLMLRSLGEIAAAESAADKELAIQKWNTLKASGQGDEVIAGYLSRFAGSIQAIAADDMRRVNQFVQTAQYKNLQSEVLQLARGVRKNILETNDAAARAQLEQLRREIFALVDFLAGQLVSAAESGQRITTVDPYLREFWQLYWGEMGLVEGLDVQRAMYAFGAALNDWSDLPSAASPPVAELKDAAQKLRGQLAAELHLPLPAAPAASGR